MTKDATLSFIRHGLTFGGGYLVAQGFLDESSLTQAVSAIITLIGISWGVYDKKGRNAQA